MSSSNLPPGLSESSIPGNTPRDEWWEAFWDSVDVAGIETVMPPAAAARLVNELLAQITRVAAEAFRQGDQEGQHYGAVTAAHEVLDSVKRAFLSAPNNGADAQNRVAEIEDYMARVYGED